ncbi:MAG: hypothetical protein ACEQSF_01615 [Solirubrobacteraceae bacterium]
MELFLMTVVLSFEIRTSFVPLVDGKITVVVVKIPDVSVACG